MKLPYLKRSGTWPSGNVRYYIRKRGCPPAPMPDLPPEHPDFRAAYEQALSKTDKKPRAATGTLGRAILDWQSSKDFRRRAASTQAVWRRILSKLAEDYGSAQVSDVRSRHIKADLARLKPHAANNRRKVWRALFSWLAYMEAIDDNPALAVSKEAAPSSDGHKPWTRDDIAQFRECWPIGTAQRLAFELIYWTGARRGDAVRLGSGHVRGDWLCFTQEKTGAEVQVPWGWGPDYAEPDDYLTRCLEARNTKHIVFMATLSGKPRSSKSFGAWFASAARKAGIDGKSAHGVRKARAIVMRENGATTDQRATWLGHETLAEVQRYGKDAEARRIISGTKSDNFTETKVTTFEKGKQKQ